MGSAPDAARPDGSPQPRTRGLALVTAGPPDLSRVAPETRRVGRASRTREHRKTSGVRRKPRSGDRPGLGPTPQRTRAHRLHLRSVWRRARTSAFDSERSSCSRFSRSCRGRKRQPKRARGRRQAATRACGLIVRSRPVPVRHASRAPGHCFRLPRARGRPSSRRRLPRRTTSSPRRATRPKQPIDIAS